MSYNGKSHVLLEPHNSIIYDWVESTEKKWEEGKADTEDNSYRMSKIAWLDPPNIVKNELMTAANVAVKEGKWFFDLKRIEPLQYTVYGEGGKYDWHIDPHDYGYSEMFKGVRKLSMTMYLNDGYEGGNFQIETGGPNNPQRYLTFFPEKGAILFFPSITWHRVTPVIRGIRKSLVAWFLSDHG
jgi:PKHD-type hydroxylase|tara:strand:- start:47 stop:598 length:552 start_codon:yes stop_codon:yes gene_type:complete